MFIKESEDEDLKYIVFSDVVFLIFKNEKFTKLQYLCDNPGVCVPADDFAKIIYNWSKDLRPNSRIVMSDGQNFYKLAWGKDIRACGGFGIPAGVRVCGYTGEIPEQLFLKLNK